MVQKRGGVLKKMKSIQAIKQEYTANLQRQAKRDSSSAQNKIKTLLELIYDIWYSCLLVGETSWEVAMKS